MLTRKLSDAIYYLIKLSADEKPLKSVGKKKSLRELNFSYKVIGIRPRKQDLALKISNQSRTVEIIGFNGFSDELSSDLWNSDATLVIHNRKLSRGELGCARSHQLAYQSRRDEDWIVFLEDDVEIESCLSEIEDTLATIGKKPTVVMLEPDNSKSVILPFWKKKSCTHAYAVNKSALDLINNTYFEIWSVADWPIQWAFQMRFITIRQSAVRLNANLESLIDNERLIKKQEFNKSTLGLPLTQRDTENKLEMNFVRNGVFRLYLFLRANEVKKPLRTAFLASKSGLYASGTQ